MMFWMYGRISLVLVVLAMMGSVRCFAGTWTESPLGSMDAGDLPTSAQVTTGVGTLEGITGTLNPFQLIGSTLILEDVDMFCIQIDDIDQFSASVSQFEPVDPLAPPLLDTFLFLFDSNGNGVIADNDADGAPFPALSEIEAGSLSGMGLNPGDYYIAITEGVVPDLPVDGNGIPIFPEFDLSLDFGLGSVASTPSTGPIASWQFSWDDPFAFIVDEPGAGIDGESAPYAINLSYASFADRENIVPEPVSLAIWACIGLTALPLRRQLRRLTA